MTIASLLLVLSHRCPSRRRDLRAGLARLPSPTGAAPAARCARPSSRLAQQGYPIKSIDIDRAPDLAEKYGVQAVPTFIVVDAAGNELDRTSGSQPAAQLARFYLEARAKAKPPANSRSCQRGRRCRQPGCDEDDRSRWDRRAPTPTRVARPENDAEEDIRRALSKPQALGDRGPDQGAGPGARSGSAPARSSTARPRSP